MRYACPNCKRVFYLEAKVESPCPACGTMLQMGEGEGEGPPSAPDAEEATTAGSWLMGETDAGPFGGPSGLGLERAAATQPATPPQPSQGMPSPTSWLEGGGAAPPAPGAGLGPPPAPPPQDPVKRLKAATQPMPASRPEPSQSRMPTAGYPPAKQAPSGTKLLMVTAATILITLAVATAVLLLLPKDKTPGGAASGAGAAGGHAEIAGLKTTIGKLREEMSKYKDGLDVERAGRKKTEEELVDVRQQVDSLKASLDRRAEATRKALTAQELLERRVELDRAMNLTVEALKMDPDFAPAHRLRGRILAGLGRADEALGAFETADESLRRLGGAGDVEALVLAGELALTHLGDRKKAVAYYKKTADLDAESPLGLAAAARILMLEGDLAGADAKAAAAQEKAPSLALARLIRGEIAFERSLGKSGDERAKLRGEADEHLAEALRLDPDSVRACVVRGKVLIEEAELASAESGFGLRRLHRQSRAETLLSKALRLSPDLPEVHKAIAELRLGEGALRDPAIAKIRASTAVRLTDGKDASAIAALAAAQSASGDPAAAEKTMEKAVKLDPENDGYRELLTRYKTEARALKLKR